MTAPKAFTVYQDFPAAPAKPFQVDKHYLLYAAKGAMRLEYGGKTWSLPPARAALITANKAITVTIPQKMTICSALFDPGFVPAPSATLTVFEMTPLARELLNECRQWGAKATLDAYAITLFQTLSTITWRLAETPSPTTMPTGSSPAVIRALALTEAQLAQNPNFNDIANAVAISPRSLARRFSDELGMTWRHALRKMRMIRAIEELAITDAPVTQVAFAVGYNSLSAFNAAFRDFTGKTPSEYRNSFRP